MKTNRAGFDLIKEFEGYHKELPNGDAEAYIDPVGIWTIGWGSIVLNGRPVRRGDVISRKLAEELLNAEVAGFEKDVERLVKVPLNENQFSSLVSLCYNIGAGAFAGSSARRLLNDGDYNGCAQAMLLWNKGTINGVLTELPGLTRRRKAERELFLSPVEPEPKKPKPSEPASTGRPYAPCPVPAPWSLTLARPDTPTRAMYQTQGMEIYYLQCALIGLGYLAKPKDGELVGDVFNEHVEWSVKRFQKDWFGDEDAADGIVGPKTRAAIEAALTRARAPKPTLGKPVRCEFHMDLELSARLVTGTLSFFDGASSLVRKVPATSGVIGYQTDKHLWARGKGPVPPVPGQAIRFSDGYHLNTKGIEGHAFPMLPDPIMRNGAIGRSEIMLHRDAGGPGTAGCIGLCIDVGEYKAFVEWAKPLGTLPLKVVYT